MRRVGGRGSSSRGFWIGVAAVVLLASALRLPDLGNLPPGFFCDEAANGYNAYSIAKTGRDENGELLPLFVWSFGVSYKNPVFVYAAMGPIALFGLDESSVRLTAALFGIAGVFAMAVLGRLVLGPAGGWFAAALLAVVPWHLHFSRIAFELISFLPLFLFAFAALVAGLRGNGKWLAPSGVLFGLCLYAYGPAKFFVPAILLGSAVVYHRRLWELRRQVAPALLLAVLTAAPAALFDLLHADRAGQYFRNTTMLRSDASFAENASRAFEQYRRFFSRDFLFEQGDPLVRHAVPGFGELYPALLPLVGLGLLWALWPGRPAGKLLLWWLLLYPLPAALMNEAPSASRGFVGVGAFCLLAAAGGVLVLGDLASRLPWKRTRILAQGLGLAMIVFWLGLDAWRYGRAYVELYPRQAAREFQFGYREAIRSMEARRRDYDLLLMTASYVNQPQIFTAFYTRAYPRRRDQNAGYLIIDPAEFDRYEMDGRILAALREGDLYLFEKYRELDRVVTPAGGTEFVIAALEKRRRFLRQWLFLGPFASSGAGGGEDFVDPANLSRRVVPAVLGPTSWLRVVPQFVRVDLNAVYGPPMAAAGRRLDRLCAYAATRLTSASTRQGFLELGGSQVRARAWAAGQPLSGAGVVLTRTPRRFPLRLNESGTDLLVQVCKTTGEWYFTARVTDEQGIDLPDIEATALVGSEAEPATQAPLPGRSGVDG